MNHVKKFLAETVKQGTKSNSTFGYPVELFTPSEERRIAEKLKNRVCIDFGDTGCQESRWMYRGASDDYPEKQGYDVHYEDPVDCQTQAGFRRVLT